MLGPLSPAGGVKSDGGQVSLEHVDAAEDDDSAVPTGGDVHARSLAADLWGAAFADLAAGGDGPYASYDGDDGPNPWRDEIVRTIFGDVGAIRRDWSCAIERKILLHGRLYVTDRFICFYSNLFGFEKKIKIPYSHVLCVTKEYTVGVIPNAIAVITARKEYVFRSFWDRAPLCGL